MPKRTEEEEEILATMRRARGGRELTPQEEHMALRQAFEIGEIETLTPMDCIVCKKAIIGEPVLTGFCRDCVANIATVFGEIDKLTPLGDKIMTVMESATSDAELTEIIAEVLRGKFRNEQ